MHHRIYEDDDGNTVQEFDLIAIDYFIKGLEELRDSEPGTRFTTPSVHQEDGEIVAMGDFIIKRVEEEPE